MDINFSFNLEITPIWELIEKIKAEGAALFSRHPRDFEEEALLVATELLQNAEKYGRTSNNFNGIQFSFSGSDTSIHFKISNVVSSEEHFQQFKVRIDKIIEAEDPALLYQERLRELFENTSQSKSQLGLYLITGTCKYQLSYTYENSVLTVVAEKKLSGNV